MFQVRGSCDKIHNYLLIGDLVSAVEEAELLENMPLSGSDRRILLRTYALAGRDERWFEVFDRLNSDSEGEVTFMRDVLEDFCWGILQRGFTHSSTLVRTISVLASGMAGDIRVVPLLQAALEDDYDLVRYLSVNTIIHYPTKNLKDRLLQVCRTDPSPFVRSGAYSILAKLKISEAVEDMIRILNDKLIGEEEKKTAVKSLALLEYSLGTLVLNKLSSPRETGLLSCEIVKLQRTEESENILLGLLRNGCEEVKIAALRTAMSLGRKFLLQSKNLSEEVRSIARVSPVPKTVITASALLALLGDCSGYETLQRYLLSNDPLQSRMSAGFMPFLGMTGMRLAKECLNRVSDIKTRVDLALTLLLFREEIESAGDVIKLFLSSHSHDVRTFGSESSFLLDGDDLLRNYGGADLNRFIGLKFVNLLMVCQYSKTYDVFIDFLSGKNLKGFGFFSRVFWEEEVEDVREFLSKIYDHPSSAVRLEAILSSLSWRDNDQIFEEIKSLYYEGSWQEKIAVLEALALSGGKRTIPFLIDCCRESMPSLKAAAAGALFMVLKK